MPKQKKLVNVYGWNFWDGTPPLAIEMYAIQRGGFWYNPAGKKCGMGLFHHYRRCFEILWPQDDNHRWSDLILKTFCENEITVITGCGDSGKTDTMSKIALVDYWCFPDKTLWLISTTEGRGSELRVWGHIKDLFNRAKTAGHELAGKPIDYLKTITTDSIDEDRELARSLKRGMVVIPCKTGGLSSGLAAYIGIKAPRLRHCGDEVAVMSDSFLNAYANWYGKEDFKGMMAGNFMESDDPLGIASEPVDGWDSFVDTGKTQEWRSRFYNAAVVALDGRDSPNFDYPDHENTSHFRYLIGHKKLDGVAATKGKDSWEWYSQCVGKPVSGMDIWRVLSRSFCQQRNALNDTVWKGSTTSIYALDPAYGGGDRCVGREIKFGDSVADGMVLRCGEPEIIPISIRSKLDPEEQIADYIKVRLEQLGIPPENCFYDSFGRGTLGFAFAKLFGSNCPVPVDSGAQPSSRPVRFDLFTDDSQGSKRLVRCDEYYTKFITELWFSVREVIDAGQMRNLDSDTLSEGCSRKFVKNKSNKIEVESKADFKERVGKSPDLFDNLAIGVEGARQLGFKIQRMGGAITGSNRPTWLLNTAKSYQELVASKQLQR